MYKDKKVFRFNVKTFEIELLDKEYVPVCIRRKDEAYSFDSVKQFCSLRVLLMFHSDEFKELFLKMKSVEVYEAMLGRLDIL